ncbi:hypothetical protein [Paenibacillus xylanilyticus]|uniref:Phage tail tape measure protein n=1 Tax=Paenibacillus xylanilyticus TaxID=248903 RepID=A0A7Y6EU20_9BACL|nr:hypothetical protein [Paenibacillus xylanilyticus]NUU74244.1 hypothetical protein [Paenibacillus xylanilyticus]
MNFVSSRADVSQFTLDEFLDAGKSFIPTTKDNKQLEKMVNLAERLGALDPEQGITGASYALKELFSGDGLSLVERFELPRSAINQIKKLPIKDQLVQLDKFLNKIGATNELIDAQSKTAMGQWRTAIGGVNRAFREMGTDALTSIKPMLAEFNNWIKGPQFTALKTWGVDAFSGLVEGAVKSVREATSYIQSHFINNPKFQKLPDISSKIKFVFDDLMQNFRDWYSGGGANKIKTMASNIVDTLGMALKASRPLLEAATEIGRKVGASILEGIWSNSGIEEFFSIDMKSVANRKLTGTDMMQIAAEYGGDKTPGGVKAGMVAMGVTPKGHSGGLDRVPYSGYTARLHQDEMVLTSQEARDYRESSNGKSAPTIMITGNTFNVRKDSDIEAIAGVLAARLAM